jgi:hypothetical protein
MCIKRSVVFEEVTHTSKVQEAYFLLPRRKRTLESGMFAEEAQGNIKAFCGASKQQWN